LENWPKITDELNTNYRNNNQWLLTASGVQLLEMCYFQEITQGQQTYLKRMFKFIIHSVIAGE
jgi:hypothetical protein